MGMSSMATGMGSFGMNGAAMMPGMPTSEYPIGFSQGWPVAFTGGICHRYLPVNTGMDNTPKSGVYRHLLAFINI